MNRVICLGNGESRLGLDLDDLRKYAIIWGCNAIYRDWAPDRLVCLDIEMSHECYRSGYCFEHITYFRDWCRLPEEAYDLVVTPSHISRQDVNNLESYIHEGLRVDDWNEFVMSGQDLDRMLQIREDWLTRFPDSNPADIDIVLGDKRAGLWVTWVAPEDKVIKSEALPGNSDYSFSSGALASLLASYNDNPEEIYLVGMDLYSTTGKANNIYKGTECYIAEDGSETPPDHWIQQHKLVFDKFPYIKYYKVNAATTLNNDRINRVIEEWSDTPNLEYITQDEMYERIT